MRTFALRRQLKSNNCISRLCAQYTLSRTSDVSVGVRKDGDDYEQESCVMVGDKSVSHPQVLSCATTRNIACMHAHIWKHACSFIYCSPISWFTRVYHFPLCFFRASHSCFFLICLRGYDDGIIKCIAKLEQASRC